MMVTVGTFLILSYFINMWLPTVALLSLHYSVLGPHSSQAFCFSFPHSLFLLRYLSDPRSLLSLIDGWLRLLVWV